MKKLCFFNRHKLHKWILQGKYTIFLQLQKINLFCCINFNTCLLRTIEFYKEIRSYGDLILHHPVTTNPVDDKVFFKVCCFSVSAQWLSKCLALFLDHIQYLKIYLQEITFDLARHIPVWTFPFKEYQICVRPSL